MRKFAFCDDTGTVVSRINEDGSQESYVVTALEYLAYVAAGNMTDPYVAPVAVPGSISDRQFFQQLAIDGIISEDDALAANAAVIPPPLLAIVDQLPASQRFDAKMKISGATTFLRDDPLTVGIGQAYGMSPADIDAFFVAAAAL